jgi:hypothetical protein
LTVASAEFGARNQGCVPRAFHASRIVPVRFRPLAAGPRRLIVVTAASGVAGRTAIGASRVGRQVRL